MRTWGNSSFEPYRNRGHIQIQERIRAGRDDLKDVQVYTLDSCQKLLFFFGNIFIRSIVRFLCWNRCRVGNLQFLQVGNAQDFKVTGIYSLGSILGIIGKSSFVFYIYPVTGFDAVLVILPGSGNRVGSGNAFFIFYGKVLGVRAMTFPRVVWFFSLFFLWNSSTTLSAFTVLVSVLESCPS